MVMSQYKVKHCDQVTSRPIYRHIKKVCDSEILLAACNYEADDGF